MPNEIYNEMYFLFLNIKNISNDDLNNTLDSFLKENINDGISQEYILNTLRDAFERGEVMGVTITDTVTLRHCNEWLKKQATKLEPELFINYLRHPKKEKLLKILHELLDNKKGKIYARTILALQKSDFLKMPERRAILYRAMQIEFGDIGNHKGINTFLAPNALTDLEINETIRLINKELL